MIDLLVNSLRMRPDRIIVGEIRRKEEAQVLMESMHTGHSVYATIHASTAEETVTRLTNPPIDVPKKMLSSLSLILVQNRNRKTGKRRTFQIAEITPEGEERILMQYNVLDDTMVQVNNSISLMKNISLYTGMTKEKISQDLKEKVSILKWMVKNKVSDIHDVGNIMTKYYTGRLKIKK